MLNHKKIMIILTILVLVLTACGEKKSNGTIYGDDIMEPQVDEQETTEVKVGNYEYIHKENVTIEKHTANLTWQQQDTSYQEVLVKRGQLVKKGDVLIRFNVDANKTKLTEQKSQLEKKKQEIEAQKQQYLSAIEEAEKGLVGLSSHQLEIARLNIEKVRINLEQYVYQTEPQILQLEETINTLESRINNNCLTAPFDGIIEEIDDEVIKCYPGMSVSVGRTLISMYSTEDYVVKIKAGSSELQYNMDVTLTFQRYDVTAEVKGKIVTDPLVLQKGKDTDLIIKLDGKIPPELIETGKKAWICECKIQDVPNVLLVDSDAICMEWGETFVYVLEDGVKKKRNIIKAFDREEEWVWILDGVSEGQTLLIPTEQKITLE